jgi:hypothetical protein
MAPDRDPSIKSTSKNRKKNLESYYYYVTFFDFLSFKNDVPSKPSKSNKHKILDKEIVFWWLLEGQ